MEKVKELTPRRTHISLEQAMETINEWYQGWATYFKMTQYPAQLKKIEAHIRRRLRARIVRQQKRRRHLYNKLTKLGINKGLAAKTAYSNCNLMGYLSRSFFIYIKFIISLLNLKTRIILFIVHNHLT